MSPAQSPEDFQPNASAWPALVALAVVIVLPLVELAFDLVSGQQTTGRISAMVDNSLQSVAIADDLRYQAARLAAARDDAGRIASVTVQIDADLHAYEPLATEVGEREELTRLRGLFAELRTAGATAVRVDAIEDSVDHLVEINQRAAQASAEAVRDAHQRELVLDTAVGVITLAVALGVAVVILRNQRRQRALATAHVATLGARNRELAAFAARTSHDLKGPLSPLRGYADMLTTHDQPEVREVATRIRRAADRMTAIVEDLLELSVHGRPAAGEVVVAPIVLELLDELRGELAGAEVVVALGDVTTACSAGVLAQIMRNLMTNAAKYRAPERRLVLRVEAKRDGHMAEIAVVDNGVGMSQETIAHAFEPLYRAPSASAPGHGLGLSIVRRAVEAVGGSCRLESKYGEGSRAIVRLPLAS